MHSLPPVADIGPALNHKDVNKRLDTCYHVAYVFKKKQLGLKSYIENFKSALTDFDAGQQVATCSANLSLNAALSGVVIISYVEKKMLVQTVPWCQPNV